jgi:hypothetical protein
VQRNKLGVAVELFEGEKRCSYPMKGSLHFISLQSALPLRAPFLNAFRFLYTYAGIRGSSNLIRNVRNPSTYSYNDIACK